MRALVQRLTGLIVAWALAGFVSAAAVGCRPTEVTPQEAWSPLVPEASATGNRQTPAEKTVVVSERKTAQVVITSTPTPLPRGGIVTRATMMDAQTPNPILAADKGSIALCSLMFEGLLLTDPFTGEWVPNLAEGWTISDDGLDYTFSIRQGLEWSDGHPITAHDFYFSYAALMSGELDTPNTDKVEDIEQIEVLDDYTVKVTFATADCAHLDRLRLGWLPMHVFTADVSSYDWREMVQHEFSSRPTVFSGPFVLEEWTRGYRWVQLRNERYWRGPPHLDGIVTKLVSGQDEMVSLLVDEELDVGQGFDPGYLSEVESVPHLRLWKLLSDEYEFLGFQMGNPEDPQPRLTEDGELNVQHGDHPILYDRRVRQAIAHALDREELIAKARLGQGIPLHANVLPTIGWAYNTDLAPREHDPEMAGLLLDEAGWVMNPRTGVRAKGGRRLRIRLHTNAGNEVRETMAALIRDQLSAVGIEVEVIAIPWPALRDLLFGQTFDVVLVSWSNLGTNPHDAHLWRAQDDVPGVGANFVSYYEPDVEALFAEVSALPTCDQDARAGFYRQIQARLYEDQPYLWLGVPRNLLAVHERVGGVNPGPWNVWYNVHEWYIRE